MKQIDAVVLKETKYIAFWVLLFSILLQAVFLIVGKWDITVLLGTILSGALGVLNFFLMGLSVQKALTKDEKEAKTIMKLSQTYRTLLLLAVLAIGVSLSCFNTWALLISIFFPRVAAGIRPYVKKDA